MSLKKQLADAKKLWAGAKKKKPEFGNEVPDGTYVGRLTKASVGESQSSGRLQVAFAATISAGEQKGETIYWYSGLKTEENFMYLQRDIQRLGKEVPDDIDALAETLEELAEEKPSIRFKVVTNGEFQNVRILKKLNSEEAPEGEDETPAEEDAVAEDAVAEEAPEEPEAEPEVAAEPEPEPEAEPEAEEEATVEVGTRVLFKVKGKETVGKVDSIVDPKKGIVRVKSDAGPAYKVHVDQLAPAPKTKVSKKK